MFACVVNMLDMVSGGRNHVKICLLRGESMLDMVSGAESMLAGG
jgi:hypothetical protein